ncbi:MAG: hypothetical protein HYT97_04925 [Elusimicrobia bacterium]|nr:hypothetical protein [Elusimicrobiota bacterium]
MNLEKLKKIDQVASQESAVAISKMVNEPVSIDIHTLNYKVVPNTFLSGISEEPLVSVISYTLTGDIVKASILMILSKWSTFTLADLLLKRKARATQNLDDMAMNAVIEFTNIIVGKYLSAFSSQLGLTHVLHYGGNLSWGTGDSIVSQITTRARLSLEERVLIELVFSFQKTNVKGHLVFMFGTETIKSNLG